MLYHRCCRLSAICYYYYCKANNIQKKSRSAPHSLKPFFSIFSTREKKILSGVLSHAKKKILDHDHHFFLSRDNNHAHDIMMFHQWSTPPHKKISTLFPFLIILFQRNQKRKKNAGAKKKIYTRYPVSSIMFRNYSCLVQFFFARNKFYYWVFAPQKKLKWCVLARV